MTALNGVLSSIQSLTGYDPTTQTAGALNGNATLESFQNQLESILDEVEPRAATGVCNRLADGSASPQRTLYGSYSSNTDTTALSNVAVIEPHGRR